jgi:hypothetical protein
MPEGRIDYELGFTADTAAIKAAADEMLRNKAAWDDAPASIGLLDAAEKKQSATTRALTQNKSDLKKALHLVATGSTEAGLAANFLMGRMAGLIGVGMYLIAQTKAGIDSLMASIATPAWEGFVGIVERQRKAFREAALAAGLYQREVARAEFARDSASEGLGRLEMMIKARLAGEDLLAEKRKQNEIAWVNESVVRAEARASRIAEIERKYEAQKLEREQKAEIQRLAIAQLKAAKDKEEQGALEGIRNALRAQGQGLGTKESLDAEEAAIRDRIKAERERADVRDRRREELMASPVVKAAFYGQAANPNLQLIPGVSELNFLTAEANRNENLIPSLERVLSQTQGRNAMKLRLKGENEQAVGWVESDIRGLAGSRNAAERAQSSEALASLLGVNARAAAAGGGQMSADQYSRKIYEEMVRLNQNLEAPYQRK